MIFFRSTLLRSHSMTSAKWLIFLMSFLMAVSSSGVTRSTLFNNILSEKATCWTASFTAPALDVVSGGRGVAALSRTSPPSGVTRRWRAGVASPPPRHRWPALDPGEGLSAARGIDDDAPPAIAARELRRGDRVDAAAATPSKDAAQDRPASAPRGAP